MDKLITTTKRELIKATYYYHLAYLDNKKAFTDITDSQEDAKASVEELLRHLDRVKKENAK